VVVTAMMMVVAVRTGGDGNHGERRSGESENNSQFGHD
jgi:hypothetical protein